MTEVRFQMLDKKESGQFPTAKIPFFNYMQKSANCFLSIHLATPSASLVLVISSAARRTSSGEFSTATPMPAQQIISMSFSAFPKATVASCGICR